MGVLKRLEKLCRKGYRKAKKYKPEIKLAAGIIVSGTGTVLACKKTLEVDKILDADRCEKDYLKEKYKDNLESKEYLQEVRKQTRSTGFKVAKKYAIPVILKATGVGLTISSHCDVRKLEATAIAASASLNAMLIKRDEKLKEFLGEDCAKFVSNGTTEVKTKETVVDPTTGKEVTVPTTVQVCQDGYAPWVIIYDSAAKTWTKDSGYNRMFLDGLTAVINRTCRINGSLFLNEVLDKLGLPRTPLGSVLGWTDKMLGEKDLKFNYDDGTEAAKRFCDGLEPCCVIDFNIKPEIIYDVI